MPHNFVVNPIYSFAVVLLCLIVGQTLNSKVSFLDKYNIPSAITGGIVAASIITILHFFNFNISMDVPLQETFMLMFFASVGLNANFHKILSGGKSIGLFLLLTTVFLILQDGVGVGLAKLLNLDPIYGLVAGSITLSGGHGTAVAWADVFQDRYGIDTLELGLAAATFGLVAGGLIGGPLAHKRISSFNLQPKDLELEDDIETSKNEVSPTSTLYSVFLLFLCVISATYLKDAVEALDIDWLNLPKFVFALFSGIIITSLLELKPKYRFSEHSMDFVAEISLSLFLSMALVNLQLWKVFNLALPLLIILAVQTVIMAIFAYWITFKVMGSDYDAAVILGGQCGFGLGSTPTAVTIMNSVVSHHGISKKAFLVIPIAGAFFNDLINLFVIEGYLHFFR
ncbi:sodium/glutamate symporter [Shewanella sp. 202IG2-18]|uniref:sodium/glutamate symporter n=1 Tax=Parashewanella hymeniacidonis TaxID=2807618 RepID=UPI00195F90CC|nr:sodium/glutamate symporter [Parashewanella hymeniacidonis]MBM7070770.1 sodium/glutamate symporter [Parashewanella hymeniacidonis]